MKSFYDDYQLMDGLNGNSPKSTPLFESQIWSGIHQQTRERVIVKEIYFTPVEGVDKKKSMAAKNQFREEKRLLELLQDVEEVVHLVDYFEEDDTIYLVLEYVDGETVSNIFRNQGYITRQDNLELFIRIADAMEKIHDQKIIHRDLTPNNIFVLADGTIKIIDFGLAFCKAGVLDLGAGTGVYVPPEALKYGHRPERTYDIFSFGVLMYLLLTRRFPFLPGEVNQLVSVELDFNGNDEIPVTLRQLITKCVQKDPHDRPGSMRIVAAQLRRILQHAGY